jgi:putative ABC transport system permease protein
MGFTVTMLISLVGFIIYWILSLQSRRLQFGIFRAMGMTKWRVIGIVVLEQIMISVVAIIAGIMIGGLTSDLFVPLLQMVYSTVGQKSIPFEVIANRGDYLKIYAVMGFMLASGLAVLGVIISRIKVAQAIKLGEE